ncbi:MAG: TolC family protein [Raineya sp.]|jgi:outer membrane protein TolC|nr:TolC family protein [Raineya sp.]
MMRYIYFLFIFLTSFSAFAQIDSTGKNTFSIRDLYAQMLKNHPMVKAINYLPRIAQEEVRIAKGGFDPKLQADYVQKTLQDKFYYSYWDSHLKAPTWIGDLKVGYELNEGALMSSENKTPSQGLMYAGLSIPLGQGLLIDARRTVLRQAQIGQKMAEAERIKELNKLFFSASKDYWEWYFRYNELLYIQKGYQLAEERFKFIQQRLTFGETAAIDTIEAKITLQERTVQLRQAEIDFKNAGLVLSNHLWIDELPVELPFNAIPESLTGLTLIDETKLNQLIAFAQENHPELQKIRFKIAQLDIERRFQQDRLKPQVNLNYNVLAGYNNARNINWGGDYFTNNYKFGFDVSFPILLRKERGKIFQTRFKLDQNKLDQSQTAREINTEIKATYNEIVLLAQNIALQQTMVNNLEILRNAEYQRFANGESSVFLINSRESKLIESQVKLVALQSKYEKAKVMLRWAAGERFWE